VREKYCWLIAGGWFILREKYCWLVADKPNEQADVSALIYHHSLLVHVAFPLAYYSLRFKFRIGLGFRDSS
jgi:hypothetical protein